MRTGFFFLPPRTPNSFQKYRLPKFGDYVICQKRLRSVKDNEEKTMEYQLTGTADE